jgi:hypothetical protein
MMNGELTMHEDTDKTHEASESIAENMAKTLRVVLALQAQINANIWIEAAHDLLMIAEKDQSNRLPFELGRFARIMSERYNAAVDSIQKMHLGTLESMTRQ